MIKNRDHYLESSLKQIPRLLTLLDKEFLSPTCGSFDRPYWHHKTKDFSSAALQQGILSLALVWKHELPGNIYYQSDYIFRLIIKAFYFTKNIQKRDGSFDEWYWNERGWAGPTGYILHAVCQTYFLIEEKLTQNQKKDLKKFISASSLFLIRSWEKDVLANHIAMAILGVAEANKILSDKNIQDGLDQLIKKMQPYFFKNEGWSLEYDGADIGYQTGTVSFLARVLDVYNSPIIREYCNKSFEFISYFCSPDGRFSGHMGSRQTANVFYYGFEYFKNNALTDRLSAFFYEALAYGNAIPSAFQEDHYLIYRIPEFLESYLVSRESLPDTKALLPFEKENFTMIFHEAGLCIKNTSQYYCIFSSKRGGAVQLFNKLEKKCLHIDLGIAIKFKNGGVWSSLWIDPKNEIVLEENFWMVKAQLKKIRFPVFNPLKMIVFRFLSAVLGGNEHSAYYLKFLIRKILMNNLKRNSISFKRSVYFTPNKIIIEDEVNLDNKKDKISSIVKGGIFFTRVIPQTKYFYPNELSFMANEYSINEINIENGKIKARVEF